MFQIPEPCRKRTWAHMAGDERRRYCDGCGSFVYAIESCAPAEQRAILSQLRRICVALHAPALVTSRRALFVTSLMA